MELTIDEAVGYQYRSVFHPAEWEVNHASADTNKADRPDGVLDGPTARPADTDSEPG